MVSTKKKFVKDATKRVTVCILDPLNFTFGNGFAKERVESSELDMVHQIISESLLKGSTALGSLGC